MKLLVILALFALVAARVDHDVFEPIHVGPAVVDFEPEPAIGGSIDKDALLAVLRRLLDRLINLVRPQDIHIGAEPVDFELEPAIGGSININIDALLELLRRLRDRLVNRPQGIHVGAEPVDFEAIDDIQLLPALLDDLDQIQLLPALIDGFEPEPSIIDLDNLKNLLERILNLIWPEGIPRPPKPPVPGSLEELKQWFLDALDQLWPNRPNPGDFLQALKEALKDIVQKLIRKIWPNGIPPPSKPDSIQDILQWLQNAFNKLFPNGLPKPPKPTPDTVQSFMAWMEQMFNRFWPADKPRPPRPNGLTIQDLKDWIRELISILEGQEVVESPEPVPTPILPIPPTSSPLVQIIVNVKNPNAVEGSPAAVEVAPTPVMVVDDAVEPTPVILN